MSTAPAPKLGPRPRPLVGVKELAERLGVNQYWVRNAVRDKRIPYYHVGRLLRFDMTEIERWLGENASSPEDGNGNGNAR